VGVADGGFGAEVRRAMDARTDHLVREGLARRFGERTVFERGLIDTLRRRELDAVGAKIAGETGLPADASRREDRRRRSPAARARLRPLRHDRRRPRLPPRALGKRPRTAARPSVSGVIRDGGGLDLMMGRKRGLGL
jgi:hypothetical protein